jgi:hypothetical protein
MITGEVSELIPLTFYVCPCPKTKLDLCFIHFLHKRERGRAREYITCDVNTHVVCPTLILTRSLWAALRQVQIESHQIYIIMLPTNKHKYIKIILYTQ